MDQNPHDAGPESPFVGMTINERLFAAGLLDAWDGAARSRDRDTMIALLRRTDLPQAAAEQTTDTVLADPKLYGV